MSISIVGGELASVDLIDATLHRPGVTKSTEKREMAKTAAKAMGARIDALLEKKGIKYNQLDHLLGQKSTGYTSRLVAGQKTRPDPGILRQIASLLDTSVDYLVGSEEGAAAPARVEGRRAAREDVERVDGWFHEALQELGGRRYSREQVRDAREFLLSGAPLLGDREEPRSFVLGALEAARELSEQGLAATPGAILALLIDKNVPSSRGPAASGNRAHSAAVEAGQALIAKEERAMKKSGHVPPRRG